MDDLHLGGAFVPLPPPHLDVPHPRLPPHTYPIPPHSDYSPTLHTFAHPSSGLFCSMGWMVQFTAFPLPTTNTTPTRLLPTPLHTHTFPPHTYPIHLRWLPYRTPALCYTHILLDTVVYSLHCWLFHCPYYPTHLLLRLQVHTLPVLTLHTGGHTTWDHARSDSQTMSNLC